MNALQFKNNLKLITISLFMKIPPGSSYEEDDRDYLLGFLENTKEKKEQKKLQEKMLKQNGYKDQYNIPDIPTSTIKLSNL